MCRIYITLYNTNNRDFICEYEYRLVKNAQFLLRIFVKIIVFTRISIGDIINITICSNIRTMFVFKNIIILFLPERRLNTVDRTTILEEIRRNRIIAIFRGIDADRCSPAANAIYDGGIRFCEVTFNAAEEDNNYASTCDGIRNIIAGAGGRKIFVGAGTVLTQKQVVLARDAGAQFIITPNINTKVIRLARDLGMVVMPGAFTPTEIEQAYEAGADIVKIFPASAVGTAYFKAVSGPLAHIPLMAVGGVDLDNGKTFLEAGAIGLGIGGNLVNRKRTETGDYETLKKLAEEYTASIQ